MPNTISAKEMAESLGLSETVIRQGLADNPPRWPIRKVARGRWLRADFEAYLESDNNRPRIVQSIDSRALAGQLATVFTDLLDGYEITISLRRRQVAPPIAFNRQR
jgi:hypothetical protein